MPDAVEVAIEAALLQRAVDFATARALTLARPNVLFTPPPSKVDPPSGPTVYGKYLRADFLPAPSFALGISYNAHNQHYGLFQVSVFYGQGAGELAPKRIAAAI